MCGRRTQYDSSVDQAFWSISMPAQCILFVFLAIVPVHIITMRACLCHKLVLIWHESASFHPTVYTHDTTQAMRLVDSVWIFHSCCASLLSNRANLSTCEHYTLFGAGCKFCTCGTPVTQLTIPSLFRGRCHVDKVGKGKRDKKRNNEESFLLFCSLSDEASIA